MDSYEFHLTIAGRDIYLLCKYHCERGLLKFSKVSPHVSTYTNG